MEHRWGHRVPVDVHVQLLGFPASIGWGRLRDVSLSGGFVETDLALRPLSSVQLILPHDGARSDERNAVQAIVVRVAADGLGVEWVDDMPEIISAATRADRAHHAIRLQTP